MKKDGSHKTKKLVLNRETIARLSEADLAHVLGGMMPVSGDAGGAGCYSYDINYCGNSTTC